jgi:hypothetical protein
MQASQSQMFDRFANRVVSSARRSGERASRKALGGFEGEQWRDFCSRPVFLVLVFLVLVLRSVFSVLRSSSSFFVLLS